MYGKLEDPDGLQGLVRLRQGGPRPEDQRLAAEKAGNWSEALTLYEQALQHSGGTAGSGRQAAGAAAAAGLLDGAGGAGGGSMAGPGEAGLGAMQRGYLDCLLHMGHLQGLLTQASPLAVPCCAQSFLEICCKAAGCRRVHASLADTYPLCLALTTIRSCASSSLQVEGLAGEARPSAAGQLAALGAAASWRLGQWERVKGYAEIASQTYSQLDADARWEVGLGLWGGSRFVVLNPSSCCRLLFHHCAVLACWAASCFPLPAHPIAWSRFAPPQVRMARLLWSVAHRDFDALQRDLQRARSEVMGPFSGAGWLTA